MLCHFGDPRLGPTANCHEQKVLYNAQIQLGTPGQKIDAQIDTGSSDLWVNSPDSKICRSKGNPCKQSGTFNKDKSKTYERVNSDFNITYVDGSQASGDYGTDVFQLGDLKLDKLQFGLGLHSTSESKFHQPVIFPTLRC